MFIESKSYPAKVSELTWTRADHDKIEVRFARICNSGGIGVGVGGMYGDFRGGLVVLFRGAVIGKCTTTLLGHDGEADARETRSDRQQSPPGCATRCHQHVAAVCGVVYRQGRRGG